MNAPGDDAIVPDHLVCCVCLDAPAGRVEQCPRGHIMCAHPTEAGAGAGEGSCLAELRAHAAGLNAAPLCPTCRCLLPAELQRNLVAEQAVARLPAGRLAAAEVPVLRRPRRTFGTLLVSALLVLEVLVVVGPGRYFSPRHRHAV